MTEQPLPSGSDGHPGATPKPVPSSEQGSSSGSAGYDLAGFDVDEPPARPAAPVPPVPPLGEKKTGSGKPRRKRAEDAEAAGTDPPRAVFPATLPPVTQVWTRWGEWGRPVFLIAAAFVVAALCFFLVDSKLISGFVAIFLMAALLVPAYALFTTLERPVRITGERALRDYFESLNHHRPSYPRMYLLLTDHGRHCDQFRSFAEFVRYWKGQLKQIKGTNVKPWQPLDFQLKGYKGEVNPEKTYARATASLEVRPRGVSSGRPLAVYPLKVGIVKGPDGMWYLNDGALPEPASGGG